MSERLRVVDVAKRFPGPTAVEAVRAASFAVAAGEMLLIRGPSGAGKTTLLAIAGALLRPDRGHVLLDGEDVGAWDEAARRTARATRIGFVFQRGAFCDDLTIHENLTLVADARGMSAGPRADALLDAVGLTAHRNARPAQLSAGESQRAAIARALVMHPAVVLADEPTAHLDGDTGARMITLLTDLAHGAGAALIVASHDPRLRAFADRVAVMTDGVLREA